MAGPFWDQYALKLVQPEYVTLPFTIRSEMLLDELQNTEMKSNAISQQVRLMQLSRILNDYQTHRLTLNTVKK